MTYLGLVTAAGKRKCGQVSFDEGEVHVDESLHDNFCLCPHDNLVYASIEQALRWPEKAWLMPT